MLVSPKPRRRRPPAGTTYRAACRTRRVSEKPTIAAVSSSSHFPADVAGNNFRILQDIVRHQQTAQREAARSAGRASARTASCRCPGRSSRRALDLMQKARRVAGDHANAIGVYRPLPEMVAARAARAASYSIVISKPSAGNAVAIHNVEYPMLVPISRIRRRRRARGCAAARRYPGRRAANPRRGLRDR